MQDMSKTTPTPGGCKVKEKTHRHHFNFTHKTFGPCLKLPQPRAGARYKKKHRHLSNFTYNAFGPLLKLPQPRAGAR